MALASEAIQTITRLTPLAEVLAAIDTDVKPVTPRTIDVAAAAGRTLAADASAPARPSAALALLDGWALSADLTIGAGGYSPAMLAEPPSRIEAGQPLPPDTDSVAPFDAVKVTGGRAEALVAAHSRRRRAGGGRRLRSGDPAAPCRRPAEHDRSCGVCLRWIGARHRARAARARAAAARQRHHHRRRAAGGVRYRAARRRGAARRRRPQSRRRAGGGKRRRHRRHRRHRQRAQRHQRADAGARGKG